MDTTSTEGITTLKQSSTFSLSIVYRVLSVPGLSFFTKQSLRFDVFLNVLYSALLK